MGKKRYCSKIKLDKSLLDYPQPHPPKKQWPLQEQYGESDSAKGHYYAKNKKDYLSIYLAVYLLLFLQLYIWWLSWHPWVNWRSIQEIQLGLTDLSCEMTTQGPYSVLWSMPHVCVFLKHMVYAVSVWQKHLCLKYSLTVPCHLAKQCGLFRTNLLWLTTERCMCVSKPLPMNRQKDHLGTWHLHIFEQS